MDSIIVAANNRQHDKFLPEGKKFVICGLNWNDYGFYTLHELFLIQPDKLYNIKLADLKVFNYDQKFGDHTNFQITNYTSYISNVESANRMLIFLTPDERKKIISELHIRFSVGINKEQPAFLKSVLRDITFEEFEQRQETIKQIVSSEINMAQIIRDNIEIIKLL